MKKTGLYGLILALAAVLWGIVVGVRGPVLAREPEAGSLWYQQTRFADGEETLTLLTAGETRSLTLRDYLLGAVAAEMPASFPAEALKAQAVALRTYALRRLREGAPHEAALCADPGCCAAWLEEGERRALWGEDYQRWATAVREAVEATDGLILTYGAEPALAVFHASSPGATAESGAVWGESLPYLVSVPSPEGEENVPHYRETLTFTPAAFREILLAAHPEAILGENPADWFGEPIYDASGRLERLDIGGVALSGVELRRLFGLRSAAITLDVGEEIALTTCGSGHGVGMSQYGARTMAEGGADFREILETYYPGTSLTAGVPAGDFGPQ